MYIKNIHPPRGCIFFIYTLHFSLMHSQTVLGVLHAKCILSVFFDLRCESVTFIDVAIDHEVATIYMHVYLTHYSYMPIAVASYTYSINVYS